MKFFLLFYRIHKFAKSKIEIDEYISYKKKAFWAIVEGFSKAGIYWFS